MPDGLIIVKAKITLKPKEEGGRKTGFHSGYRPNHVFELPDNLKILSAHPGDIQFDDQELIEPGETKIAIVRFLKTPSIEKYITIGRKWFINEAATTIGFGEILEILATKEEAKFTAVNSDNETYKNFQLVAEILEEIKAKIHPDTDTMWTGFESSDTLLAELNSDIEKIRLCDFETLRKINVEFVPTCTYQELSMSNYWSDEYLKMANRFDKIYAKIIAQKNASSNRRPWWKFW